MKSIRKVLTAFSVLAAMTLVQAQTPVTPSTGGGGTSTAVTETIDSVFSKPDLSMLVDHPTLVAYAFQQIKGVSINVTGGSQVENYDNVSFIVITNPVKTLETIMEQVAPYWFGLQVVDPLAFVSINVEFWNTNRMYDYYGGKSPRQLFQGWSGGYPVPSRGNGWSLSTSESTVEMHMTYGVSIPIEGITSARLVLTNEYGSSYGVQLQVNNGELVYPEGYAGQGVVVITRVLQVGGVWNWRRNAYNVVTGAEVELSWVDVRVLLADSEDFRSFMNDTTIDVNVWSWDGYGKVPLVMATFDIKDVSSVWLSVHTEDQAATSFILENQVTKVRQTIMVPAGATGVQVAILAGTYYIYPQGLSLKPWQNYYGGGKG